VAEGVIAEITVVRYEIGFGWTGVVWQLVDYELVIFHFQSVDH
jgi:hypothetical protein